MAGRCGVELKSISETSLHTLCTLSTSSALSTAGSRQDGDHEAGHQLHLHRDHGQGHHGGPVWEGDQAGKEESD